MLLTAPRRNIHKCGCTSLLYRPCQTGRNVQRKQQTKVIKVKCMNFSDFPGMVFPFHKKILPALRRFLVVVFGQTGDMSFNQFSSVCLCFYKTSELLQNVFILGTNIRAEMDSLCETAQSQTSGTFNAGPSQTSVRAGSGLKIVTFFQISVSLFVSTSQYKTIF